MKTLKERAQALLEKFNACKSGAERKNLGWELAEFVEELANAPEPEPVAWNVEGKGGETMCVTDNKFAADRYIACGYVVEPLYTAPPAPSVPDEVPDAVIDAVADAIGGAYDCLRVWSAWGYGTMGPDDFLPVTDDADRVAEIARAALSSWLAAAPTPAEPPEAVVRDAVAAEREACAKVCEKISDEYDENEGLKYAELRTDAATGCGDCAAAIRARGEKGGA